MQKGLRNGFGQLIPNGFFLINHDSGPRFSQAVGGHMIPTAGNNHGFRRKIYDHTRRTSQSIGDVDNQMRTDNQQQTRMGYLFVVLAAILFGISGTAAKFLFNAGVTAIQLIQMRTTLAFVVLLMWLIFRRPDLLKTSIKKLPYFFCLGVLGIGSAQFFYLLAISKIDVAAAILLHYTGPVFVALYAVLVQKKRLGLYSLLAIMGTLLGCFLVVGAYNLQLFAFNRVGIAAGSWPPWPLPFTPCSAPTACKPNRPGQS